MLNAYILLYGYTILVGNQIIDILFSCSMNLDNGDSVDTQMIYYYGFIRKRLNYNNFHKKYTIKY